MRLLEFVSLIQPLRGDGQLNREVNGVAWDCRRVSPGNLFIAIPGLARDTQAAIDVAIERGAAAVLCEGREVVGLRATRIQAQDVRASLPRVAELFFGQPDRRLKLIGVCGASGTSAPAQLLRLILDAAGFKCGLIGSFGCEIGERQLPPLRRHSETLDYHELLAQMVKADCRACVIEFGPEAIEGNRVGDLAFDAVVFTSLPRETAAVIRFCRGQANGAKRFTALFNIDDEIGRALFESRLSARQLSFGFREDADVRGWDLQLAHRSLGMVVAAGGTEIRLRTRLTGRLNAHHLLAACAGGIAMQAPLSLMRFTMQKAPVPEGVLEPVGDDSEIAVYVDGARSDAEVRLALESVREITSGRLLLAVSSTAGESYERRCQIGRLAGALADYTVITANNPGRESAAQIAAQIERGLEAEAHSAHHIELNRAQAIHDLVESALPGDSVLILGKGRETHQEFADTIIPFDDREIAATARELRGTVAPKIIFKSVRPPPEPVFAQTA